MYSVSAVMVGVAPEGFQFDARQFDAKMNEVYASFGLCSYEKSYYVSVAKEHTSYEEIIQYCCCELA